MSLELRVSLHEAVALLRVQISEGGHNRRVLEHLLHFFAEELAFLDDFHRADLADESSELLHRLVFLCELADEDLEGRDVKECHSEHEVLLLVGQDVARFVANGPALGQESATGDHFDDFSLDALVILVYLLTRFLVLLQALFQHAGSLRLLDDGHLEAFVDQNAQVLIEGLLWEAHVQLLHGAHPVQVQDLVAGYRVQVEEFVELAELEKQNLLEVVLLDLPVLDLGAGQFIPVVLGNIDRRVIVHWIAGSSTFGISEVIFLQEAGQRRFDVLGRVEADGVLLVFMFDGSTFGLYLWLHRLRKTIWFSDLSTHSGLLISFSGKATLPAPVDGLAPGAETSRSSFAFLEFLG
mmetsp:Transcript_21387/g.33076  ORF Transcript_21387/g.33076 Transcript_21387/m.33076 type:complete len:352 (-) Transcript_21387:483-1538(-)